MRGNGSRIGLVLACMGLALATGAANASAAPTWLAPEDISGPTEFITFPDLAVNAVGNAVVVWPRAAGGETTLEAIERPAGGEWSQPVPLSDPAEDEEPGQAHVALDEAGNAVAIWMAFGGLDSAIRTVVRPAGGEWSDPEDLSAVGKSGSAPDLAMNAAGDAVAVWTGFDVTNQSIWAAVRPAGGEWSEPEPISAAGENSWSPRVGIDAAGNVTAVWQPVVISGDDVIQAAELPAGGEWSEPEPVSAAGENGRSPRIAVNAAGAAVVAWSAYESVALRIHAAVRPPAGGWSEPATVSASGESTGEPEVTINSGGEAFAIWSGPTGGDFVLRAAQLPPGGEWSEPEPISIPVAGFNSYDLASSPAAGVVATWTRRAGATYAVQAAVQPPGGGWLQPDDLSVDGEDAGLPELGFDATGNAVAVWGRDTGEDYVLQGSGYDFTGPRLDDLAIPATGTAGTPVTFSVSPYDLFPLGATSWSFGDGGQGGGGNAVSHVYAAAGEYPVTVRAADASGNASTQTATIVIAGGPPPPPPPRRLALALRLGKESLRKLLWTGTLSVTASVNDAASVSLSGKARLKVGARGAAQNKLVPVFAPKTVRFAAASERQLTLPLSKRGRKALSSLSQVRLLVAGEARDLAGATAAQTAARTIR